MKILLTVHQFFPDFESGTEVLTLSVARDLRERGHEVEILTGYPNHMDLADEERFDFYHFDGFRVHRFHHAHIAMGGQNSRLEAGYDNKLAATHFGHLLKVFRPDLVHCFHLGRLGTGLIPIAVQAKVPAYFTPTDYWAICATGQLVLANGRSCLGPSRLGGNCIVHFASQRSHWEMQNVVSRVPAVLGDMLAQVTRLIPFVSYPLCEEVKAMSSRLALNVGRLNQLHRIVAPSQAMVQMLLRFGVDRNLIVQSAYGIDMSQYTARPFAASTHSPLRIGFIGTLAQHKGCHVLLEAFKMLPSGSAVVFIYGRESDFPEYASRLRQLAKGTAGISFCGTFEHGKIGEILAGIDVLVVPSVWNENTPLVIYSAQASSCPIVGSNVPGVAEVIQDGVDGLLFDPGDPTALCERLRELIANPETLGVLKVHCRRPKSIASYVDDLIAIWKDA